MNIPSFYPILVFLHVLGAVGVFVALGIEAVGLARLRQATTPAGVRMSLGLLAAPRRLAPATMLVMLAAGVWMMVVQWGPQPWIQISFLGVVAMGILGGFVSRRALQRVGQALQAESGAGLSTELRALAASRGLQLSFRVRVAIGIGILALMTVKPGLAASLVVMGAAASIGILAGVRTGRQPARGGSGLGLRVGREDLQRTAGRAPELHGGRT